MMKLLRILREYETPKEYWENEDLEGLKIKLAKMFEDTKTNICTSVVINKKKVTWLLSFLT